MSYNSVFGFSPTVRSNRDFISQAEQKALSGANYRNQDRVGGYSSRRDSFSYLKFRLRDLLVGSTSLLVYSAADSIDQVASRVVLVDFIRGFVLNFFVGLSNWATWLSSFIGSIQEHQTVLIWILVILFIPILAVVALAGASMFGVSSGLISVVIVGSAAIFILLSFILVPILVIAFTTLGIILLGSSVLSTSTTVQALMLSSKSQFRQRVRGFADSFQTWTPKPAARPRSVAHANDGTIANMVLNSSNHGYKVSPEIPSTTPVRELEQIIREGSPIRLLDPFTDESSLPSTNIN